MARQLEQDESPCPGAKLLAVLDSHGQPALEPRLRAIEREKEWAARPLFLLEPMAFEDWLDDRNEMENDHGTSRSETRPRTGRAAQGKGGGKAAPPRAARPRAPRPARPSGGAGFELKADLAAELEGIAAQAGCELVHAEWKGGTLQILIDRVEGGVTLEDCERVSKETSALLDVLDFGNTRYVLEVSSPGLDRQLYRPRDYQRFIGSKARITYSSPQVRKRTLVARLEAFSSDPESVTLHDEETDERITLRLDQIQAARLEIEL